MNETTAVVDKLTDEVGRDTSTNQWLRLKCIQHVCNAVPESTPMAQARAFSKALRMAGQMNRASLALGAARRAEQVAKAVRSQPELERDVWLAAREVFQRAEATPSSSNVHNCSVKYMETFQGARKEELEQAAEVAAASVVTFLAAKDTFQADFASLDAVKHLSGHPKHWLKHKLLDLFLQGETQDLSKLLRSSQEDVQTLGLDAGALERKIRLNSVVSLAEQYPQQALSKSRVAKELDVAEEEVEAWVISAMGAKLVSASIDQMEETLTFTRSSPRVFAQSEWESLRSKLATWCSGLAQARSLIQSRLAQQNGSAETS